MALSYKHLIDALEKLESSIPEKKKGDYLNLVFRTKKASDYHKELDELLNPAKDAPSHDEISSISDVFERAYKKHDNALKEFLSFEKMYEAIEAWVLKFPNANGQRDQMLGEMTDLSQSLQKLDEVEKQPLKEALGLDLFRTKVKNFRKQLEISRAEEKQKELDTVSIDLESEVKGRMKLLESFKNSLELSDELRDKYSDRYENIGDHVRNLYLNLKRDLGTYKRSYTNLRRNVSDSRLITDEENARRNLENTLLEIDDFLAEE